LLTRDSPNVNAFIVNIFTFIIKSEIVREIIFSSGGSP